MLAAGAAFETLAMERSIDQATRFNGGDLGYFTLDVMPDAYDAALKAAKVGDLVGPFQIERGCAVVRVEDRRHETADQPGAGAAPDRPLPDLRRGPRPAGAAARQGQGRDAARRRGRRARRAARAGLRARRRAAACRRPAAADRAAARSGDPARRPAAQPPPARRAARGDRPPRRRPHRLVRRRPRLPEPRSEAAQGPQAAGAHRRQPAEMVGQTLERALDPLASALKKAALKRAERSRRQSEPEPPPAAGKPRPRLAAGRALPGHPADRRGRDRHRAAPGSTSTQRDDLLVMRFAPGTTCAGVFTRHGVGSRPGRLVQAPARGQRRRGRAAPWWSTPAAPTPSPASPGPTPRAGSPRRSAKRLGCRQRDVHAGLHRA